MKKRELILLCCSVFGMSALESSAHCEVPCGIYADDNVFAGMKKDIETIEKAMNQINTLSKDSQKNANQIVRWVVNKEKHAQSIQDTIAKYFLTQRVTLSEAEKNTKSYHQKLEAIHQITVFAMQCKQTTDLKKVNALELAVKNFETLYSPKAKKKAHTHSHKKGHTHTHKNGHTHSHGGKSHKH